MKKFVAFTLSEVLITVGIIGVVAALTVPSLVNSYQKDAQVVQLRKVVLDIENAIDMLITEEAKTSLASTTLGRNREANGFVEAKFKRAKSCDADSTGCFATENYIAISGNNSGQFKCPRGTSYVLANSAAICMYRPQSFEEDGETIKMEKVDKNCKEDCEMQEVLQDYYIVQIDTNGADGPNVGGRDMFSIKIESDGKIEKIEDTGDAANCETSYLGEGCYRKLLNNNWKMNY